MQAKVQVPPGFRDARLYRLSLAALGVVFGDIGTSPLYAVRECFADHGLPPTTENVLGILSLVFWSLTIVISLKYLAFVMRADNHGEGGILALMTLVAPDHRTPAYSRRRAVLLVGVFGAGLLYADGMITPAISVLSAVEGLQVASPALHVLVTPLAVAVLCALFFFQRHGTAAVGRVFGPVMIVWFLCLFGLGVRSIAGQTQVLAALSPVWAVEFLGRTGVPALLVLGPVFLVVTGGEALYADMGHFGRRPIRLTWFVLVLPALLANYFGQGALLLGNPAATTNPFYLLAPAWGRLPLVVLATAATVIASQAVISGAFSLTRQALQLGYCPRVDVRHSSDEEIGQVYAPSVNWVLLVAAVLLVLWFGSSGSLAGAYGVAVSATMVLTTILAYVCARTRWGWSLPAALSVAAAFLAVDTLFLMANLTKIPEGGWLALFVASVLALLMTTWSRGRELLGQRLAGYRLPEEILFRDLATRPPLRVPGTAVFLDRTATGVPRTLLHNLKHNKVLHERVILLTIVTEAVPRVPVGERLFVRPLEHGFVRLIARFGYMETPSLPAVLGQARDQGVDCDPMDTTFFLGRETLILAGRGGMALWRKRLFSVMSRNAQRATAHYQIPPNRVVEFGAEVEL
jgi:KUP system potassium uptake protein